MNIKKRQRATLSSLVETMPRSFRLMILAQTSESWTL